MESMIWERDLASAGVVGCTKLSAILDMHLFPAEVLKADSHD